MSLQLEKDANVSVQTHIDEFSSRASILIVIWLLVSLLWMLKVDLVLEYVIGLLDPCVDSNCSNLYNPAKWSEVRWLSGALLGFITILPLIALQLFKFSRPGLMKNEAKGLIFWLIFCTLGFIVNIIFTILFIMPNLFELGHNIQLDLGFLPKYDVITMLSMSIGVIWVEILITMGILTLLVVNSTGGISSRNLNWWKMRVHGIISMLIILSFYGQVSFNVFLLLTSYISIELITSKWIRKPSRLSLNAPVIFDQYGVERKMLFVECECEGKENYSHNLSPNAFYSFNNLCENISEQETLYQLINTNSFTDLMIFGCRNNEKLQNIEPNVYISKCNFRREFYTHKRENYYNSQQFIINTDFRLASLTDPWNESQAYERIVKLLDEYDDWIPVILSNDKYSYFPDDINANDLIIYTSELTKVKLVHHFKELGRKYTIG
mgnify:FL=1